MANSEQQDILDNTVHIYACDEQQVSALIIPTDGEIRANLPVSIENAESDTVYTTTTTDTYGMINTTFFLSPGTYIPIIKCGNNKQNIYEGSVICHACSLTLTSDKDILSAADNDVATLTATLTGTESGYDGPLSNREVVFEIYQASDDTLIETLTATTNNSGVATVSYSSQGIGDISITAKVGSLVSETYGVQDCMFYDASSSVNLGKYSAQSGASFSYDSTNTAYSLYPSSTGSRFVNLNNLTFSKDNKVSIDFDITNAPSNAQYGFLIGNVGVRAIRAGSIQRITISNNSFGSDYTYTDCTVSTNTNYTLELLPTGVLNLKQGDTIVATCNYDISSLLTDTNSFKLYTAYDTTARGNVKNIKIKPIQSLSLDVDNPILSYADSTQANPQTATLTATLNPVAQGRTVKIYKDDTLVATETTDSQGQVSYEYGSQGIGDVEFRFECGLVSETYAIEDCKFYDPLTVDHSKWTVTGSLQYNEHTSNGWKYGAVDGLVWIDINNFILTEGANIEFTPTEAYGGSTGNYAPIMVYFENPSQTRVYFAQSNTFIQMNSSTKQNHNINLGTEHRIEYTGTTLKFYLGDTLVGSASHNLGTSNIKVRLGSGSNRYCRLKNFKIKPL